MVVKADHERIKTLLKDTITLLCRNGLNFKTEFSVEALIGITLDKEDVVLVSINEIIRSELGSQITLAKDIEEQGTPIKNLDTEGSGDSRPSTPVSTNGHQYRKRKRSPGHVSQKESTEDGQESDSAEDEKRSIEKASLLGDESNSEPSSKRTADEPGASRMPCIKDDTKDVIYIKEEIDTGDWPDGSQTEDSFAESNIPAASSSDQQHEDNFDFLHSSSLVPVSSDTSVQQSWGDVSSQSAPASLSISPSKRPSMATGMATQGEHSQTVVVGTTSETESFGRMASSASGRGLSERTVVRRRPAPYAFGESVGVGEGPIDADQIIKSEPVDPERLADIADVVGGWDVRQASAPPPPFTSLSTSGADRDEGDDVFAGVRLPTRRHFLDPGFTARCPLCDKSFSTYQGFMRHVDQHRGRYAAFCSVCGRGFMTKDHLGNHMRGHTGERLYCQCGAGFKTHQALRMHRKRERHDGSVLTKTTTTTTTMMTTAASAATTYEERWLNWGVQPAENKT